jgi:hypothetical protein
MARTVTLVASDGVSLDVDASVIGMRPDGSCAPYHSELVHALIEDIILDERIGTVTLSNVDGETLKMVVEFCKHHHDLEQQQEQEQQQQQQLEHPPPPDLPPPDAWERSFLDCPARALRELMLAAQYMQVETLVAAVARRFARTIVVGKLSPSAIRELLGVEGDFTAEEEEALSVENRQLLLKAH